MSLALDLQQQIMDLLPHKRKSSNKWISFNAVCCSHNGETADTRGRGGMLPNPDGSTSYHCFNCGFKTGYYPGRPMSFKFRKLLKWMGADENTVQRLTMEALRIKDLVPTEQRAPVPEVEITFKPRGLPEDSASLQEWATRIRLGVEWDPNGIVPIESVKDQAPDGFWNAVHYLHDRKVNGKKYDFYLTSETSYNLHKRVIIPFYWKKQLIGYTARAIADDVKPKYHSNYEANYVFNLDQQLPDARVVIVCEGPFDAMAIDGVAVLSNQINDTQAEIIDGLGREVIVVPDWDEAGLRMIDNALEYGWSVSFPVWMETCKDIGEAVVKYGKLFVLKTVLDAKESNRLKIELMKKRIHTK